MRIYIYITSRVYTMICNEKKKKSFFGQRQNKHTHPHVFFLSGENCILEGHRFRNRIREIDKNTLEWHHVLHQIVLESFKIPT